MLYLCLGLRGSGKSEWINNLNPEGKTLRVIKRSSGNALTGESVSRNGTRKPCRTFHDAYALEDLLTPDLENVIVDEAGFLEYDEAVFLLLWCTHNKVQLYVAGHLADPTHGDTNEGMAVLLKYASVITHMRVSCDRCDNEASVHGKLQDNGEHEVLCLSCHFK